MEMEFLYPQSEQFPFDRVCADIVNALEQRNWQVPGIEVEFDVYGSGEQKFRLARTIKGQDFKLYFCRRQRTMPGGRWNDTAAVSEIHIPQKEIHVCDDESGPTFYLYVGNDWERDREEFMTGRKVNSKLNGEPRMYLEYKGACDCRATGGAAFGAVEFLTAQIRRDADALARMTHSHKGRRSPLLVSNNDLGRGYDPEGDEPRRFKTVDVMAEFKRYLGDVVLKQIKLHPIPTEKVDLFAPPPAIPLPESIGPLFCFAEHREAQRIKQGQADIQSLAPADRSVEIGSGTRLAAWTVRNDGTVPDIAYEGFLWCGIGDVTAETPIESLQVPGHCRRSREQFVVRVKLDRANDIYIADHGPYEKRREELGAAMEKERSRFTDAEVSDFMCARARTIVPISEYKGGYEKPVVLINRELSFDEVELVSGPHNE